MRRILEYRKNGGDTFRLIWKRCDYEPALDSIEVWYNDGLLTCDEAIMLMERCYAINFGTTDAGRIGPTQSQFVPRRGGL